MTFRWQAKSQKRSGPKSPTKHQLDCPNFTYFLNKCLFDCGSFCEMFTPKSLDLRALNEEMAKTRMKRIGGGKKRKKRSRLSRLEEQKLNSSSMHFFQLYRCRFLYHSKRDNELGSNASHANRKTLGSRWFAVSTRHYVQQRQICFFTWQSDSISSKPNGLYVENRLSKPKFWITL